MHINLALFVAHGAEPNPRSTPQTPASGSPEVPNSGMVRMLREFSTQADSISENLSTLNGFSRLRGLSRRGDLRMFLADFPAALADYSEMVSIDAAQDTPHWRKGIAFYFNKRFKEGAAQFERYHAYDARDRENGLWKFLCDEKMNSSEYARANMLPYKQFDRHPFPDLYSLYGGRLSLKEYDDAVRPHAEASRIVKFFHLYYRGLHRIGSDKPSGIADIRQAVALFEPSDAEPGYMWHCARLHLHFFADQ